MPCPHPPTLLYLECRHQMRTQAPVILLREGGRRVHVGGNNSLGQGPGRERLLSTPRLPAGSWSS